MSREQKESKGDSATAGGDQPGSKTLSQLHRTVVAQRCKPNGAVVGVAGVEVGLVALLVIYLYSE